MYSKENWQSMAEKEPAFRYANNFRTNPRQKISYPGVAQLVARLLWEQEVARSSRVTRTKRTEQFRCRRLNAYGINCFRDFHPLKFHKTNDRCQQAILSVWRYLNPHTKDTKKGAELNRTVT